MLALEVFIIFIGEIVIDTSHCLVWGRFWLESNGRGDLALCQYICGCQSQLFDEMHLIGS